MTVEHRLTWGRWGANPRAVLAVPDSRSSAAALGGCGGKPAKAAASPPAHPRPRAPHRIRRDAAEAGDGRRDDGAPEEAAGDRRRPRRQPRARAPRATTPASTTSPTHCGTRVSTCRPPSSRCGCRSPTSRAHGRRRDDRGQAARVHHRHPDRRRVRAAGAGPRRGHARLHGIGLRRPARRRVPWCWWTAASASSASKQAVAAERGAVALIVANNEDGDEMGGTLGEKTDVKIPVISVTKATGERLRATRAPPPSSSTPACESSAPATSSRRPRPDPPPTW